MTSLAINFGMMTSHGSSERQNKTNSHESREKRECNPHSIFQSINLGQDEEERLLNSFTDPFDVSNAQIASPPPETNESLDCEASGKHHNRGDKPGNNWHDFPTQPHALSAVFEANLTMTDFVYDSMANETRSDPFIDAHEQVNVQPTNEAWMLPHDDYYHRRGSTPNPHEQRYIDNLFWNQDWSNEEYQAFDMDSNNASPHYSTHSKPFPTQKINDGVSRVSTFRRVPTSSLFRSIAHNSSDSQKGSESDERERSPVVSRRRERTENAPIHPCQTKDESNRKESSTGKYKKIRDQEEAYYKSYRTRASNVPPPMLETHVSSRRASEARQESNRDKRKPDTIPTQTSLRKAKRRKKSMTREQSKKKSNHDNVRKAKQPKVANTSETKAASSLPKPSSEEIRNARTPRKIEALQTWYKRFRELVEFIDRHGHANVPQQFSENHSLGIWVNKQRMEKKARDAGKSSSLTEKRVHLLEEAGFVWAKRKGQTAWEQKFLELKEFHEINGHCNVPTKNNANRALGRWVSTQRATFKKYKRGEADLSQRDTAEIERRFERLDALGFSWCLLPGTSLNCDLDVKPNNVKSEIGGDDTKLDSTEDGNKEDSSSCAEDSRDCGDGSDDTIATE